MYKMYFERVTYSTSSGAESSSRELVYMSGSYSDKYRITAPRFTQDLGQAGELTFTLFSNDHLWKSDMEEGTDYSAETRFDKLTTFVYLYRDDECFWCGRVLNETKDFYGQKSVVCEGQLAFLHDVAAGKYSFGYGEGPAYTGDLHHNSATMKPRNLLERFIDMYNNRVTSYKRIHLGNTTFTNDNLNMKVKNDEINTILDEMYSIFSSGGQVDGFFSLRYVDSKNTNGDVYSSTTYLDYHKYNDKTMQSNQGIRFGENLLDLTENIDGSDLFTVIVPLGAYTTNYKCKRCNRIVNVFNDTVKNDTLWNHLTSHTDITQGQTVSDEIINEWFPDSDQGPRLTIESVHHPNGIPKYYYPDNTTNNYRNDTLINMYGWIERIVIFEDIDDPSDLLQAGIQARALSSMLNTLEIKAYDLKLAGYDVDSIDLGDMVKVSSRVHGIYKLLQCIRVELDLEDPTNNVYYFGTKIKGITDAQISAEKKADKNIKQISYLSYRIGQIK